MRKGYRGQREIEGGAAVVFLPCDRLSMRSSAILEIIDGVNALDIDEPIKRRICQLVCDIGRQHGCKAIDRNERIAFACRLLEANISRATIAERLKARYDISREQAYRDIRAGLKLCQKSAQFDTKDRQTKRCNKGLRISEIEGRNDHGHGKQERGNR